MDDAEIRETARVGYQAAIDLWIYEGGLIWDRFNAMLVANSVILAVSGATLTADKVPVEVTNALSAAGLALCGLWALLTKRGFDYFRYWILSARELEERHLGPVVETSSRGGTYGDGDPVSLIINGSPRMLRMSMRSRSLTAAGAAYAVIAVFAILYIVLASA